MVFFRLTGEVGLANQFGFESFVDPREVLGEALTEECSGQRLSSEHQVAVT